MEYSICSSDIQWKLECLSIYGELFEHNILILHIVLRLMWRPKYYTISYKTQCNIHGFDLATSNIARSPCSHRILRGLSRVMDFLEFGRAIYSFCVSGRVFIHPGASTRRHMLYSVQAP